MIRQVERYTIIQKNCSTRTNEEINEAVDLMLSGQAGVAQVTLMVEITRVVRACWVFIQEAL